MSGFFAAGSHGMWPSFAAISDSALPANADGLAGVQLIRPQYALSPDGSMYAVGLCKSNGTQVVRIYNRVTGALVEAEHTVRAVDAAGDDHNPCSVMWYSDGSLIACATGHATTTSLHTSRRTAAGVWTDETPTDFSGNVTYPSLWLDIRGDAWVFLRVGPSNANWEYAKRSTISSAWGTPVRFMQEGSQAYNYIRYDEDNDRFIGSAGVLASDPAYGPIRIWTMNASTGAFTHDSGASLTIPFSTTTIAETFTPAAGSTYSPALPFSRDCRAAIIQTAADADINDVAVSVWNFTGDPTNPANWTQNAAVFNFGARLAYGTNNNVPGNCFEEAPHSGYAFYATRKTTVTNAITGSGTQDMWTLEKWTSPDGTTWTNTILLKHARRGASLGPVTCRPLCAFGANSRTPLMVSRMDNYTEFDTFTDPRVEFCAPWRGRNCFNLEAETQAWIDRLSTAPSALFTAQVNAMIRDFNDEGLTSRIGFLAIAPTENWEQRKKEILGGYTATVVDGTGATVADPAFTARSWFNGGGTYCLDFDMIPGVAGNHKMTQDSHCFFIVDCQGNQNGALCVGSQQFAMNPRNASDAFARRSANTASSNSANGSAAGARGTQMIRRAANATQASYYNGNGATNTTYSQNSQALSATNRFYWGAPNAGANTPGTIADRSQGAAGAGLHLTGATDNLKLDSALGANLNLMFAEAS